MDEWKRKLRTAEVRKDDMNNLVMDFLVTEGFADAAEKFRLESGTNPDIDLATVKDRMVVKKAVQNGHLVDAMEKLHNLDPKILNENPKALFSLQQQWFIELIREDKTEEALTFAKEKLGPMAEKNHFLEELERTISLLIVNRVANDSVSDLLKMSQRNKTAIDVNEAILVSQAHEKEAKLSRLLKMLAWVEKELEKMGVTYPKIKDFSTCKLEDPAAV